MLPKAIQTESGIGLENACEDPRKCRCKSKDSKTTRTNDTATKESRERKKITKPTDSMRSARCMLCSTESCAARVFFVLCGFRVARWQAPESRELRTTLLRCAASYQQAPAAAAAAAAAAVDKVSDVAIVVAFYSSILPP